MGEVSAAQVSVKNDSSQCLGSRKQAAEVNIQPFIIIKAHAHYLLCYKYHRARESFRSEKTPKNMESNN